MVSSMDKWKGKVAVVTGASAGIGAAIAKELAENGLLVVGFARRPDKVDQLSEQLQTKTGKIFGCKVDMTKEEDIKNGIKWTMDKVGPVSILINNAGLAAATTLLHGSTEDWKNTLDTNILGLCIATRDAIKIMREHNIDGHVVHINSTVGHGASSFPMHLYSASKYAITSVTDTLRQELSREKSRIKISNVSPGAVDTDAFNANAFKLSPDMISCFPKMKPKDVADAVIYVLAAPQGVQVHDIIFTAAEH